MTPTPTVFAAEPVDPDGPRLARRVTLGARLIALWSAYLLALRQQWHSRRWIIMGLLFLLPAGLAVLVRWTESDLPRGLLEFLLADMFIPQALLPLTALVYASGIIRDEQEEQTLTYLLVRPISKWALYVVKLLATLTTTVLLTVILTCLTFAAIYISADLAVDDVMSRCLITAATHSLAMIAYCSLFGLISLLTKRTLVVGVLYTVAVEGLLANLPFGIRLVAVIYYSRLIAYRTMNFVVSGPHGRPINVAAEAWQLDVHSDPKLLDHPQLGTCVAVLLLGSVICTATAAWLCARREFHVKTPEKD